MTLLPLLIGVCIGMLLSFLLWWNYGRVAPSVYASRGLIPDKVKLVVRCDDLPLSNLTEMWGRICRLSDFKWERRLKFGTTDQTEVELTMMFVPDRGTNICFDGKSDISAFVNEGKPLVKVGGIITEQLPPQSSIAK